MIPPVCCSFWRPLRSTGTGLLPQVCRKHQEDRQSGSPKKRNKHYGVLYLCWVAVDQIPFCCAGCFQTGSTLYFYCG